MTYSLNDILDDVIDITNVAIMSLGLYFNVWPGLIIIGTQGIFGVESLALTKTCPGTKFHVYWYCGY